MARAAAASNGQRVAVLESKLTLTELNQRLRTHPALLAKTINTGCGQNFSLPRVGSPAQARRPAF
jgi:hypothetical protein